MTDDERRQIRDAAFEEAAMKMHRNFEAARELGHNKHAETYLHARDDIRALKSSPTTVLPVERVREVLRATRSDIYRCDVNGLAKDGGSAAVELVAHDLGLCLDEKDGE